MIEITEADKAIIRAMIPKMKHQGFSDGDNGYYFREFTYEFWHLLIKCCNKCLE